MSFHRNSLSCKKTEQLITLGHSQVKLALARALLTGEVEP